MIKRNNYILLNTFLLFILTVLNSCTKSDFLDEKPDQALVVPETLEELKAILNNTIVMNGEGSGVVPSLGHIGADDYWLTGFSTSTAGMSLKQLYLWNEDYMNSTTKYYEWDFPYRTVLYSNIVLDGLSKLKINSLDKEQYDLAKGSALFFRAHMFYQLAQVFAPVFNQNTAAADLGIPLKLSADINEGLQRPSIEKTYKQIIDDLKLSVDLLNTTPKYVTVPSKPAAYALLARVYLSMQKYDEALLYATRCLELKNTLRDYNVTFTDIDAARPFAPLYSCEEIIFHSRILEHPTQPITNSTVRVRVDSNLYKLYAPDDLRKKAFFLKRPVGYFFKGSYEGGDQLFGGIATDEVYLIRAECYARSGKVTEAMADLNVLMKKRWLASTWTPFVATDAQDALKQILIERRKELLYRGLRWTDIRRLNLEGANIIQTRLADGKIYTLEPNSKKYTFLIPNDIMGFHPNWQQNLR